MYIDRSKPISIFTNGHKFRSVAQVLFLLLLATPIFAQGTRGTISGKVTDPNGAVIMGATVKLTNPAKQVDVRTVQTNAEGIYQFLEIEPATYAITISASGFADKQITEIRVEPNRNVQFESALSVGGATAEVTVSSATQELVDRESPTLGTTVDPRRVVGLPLNGRNVLQLALLQPGVIETGTTATESFGGGLGIRVNGNRGTENNITLDGANNNEVAVGGSTGFALRPDAVQEFRLLTSNFEAEFGRNSGSVINFVTKSGTSDFHGNARIFYRPTVLSAARYFDQDSPADPVRRGPGDYRRPFERKEFGGQIGGPITFPKKVFGPLGYDTKNRMFFFLDFETRRQLVGASQTITGVPSVAERGGDFSGLLAKGVVLTDPATGQPFPGNIIPANRISQIARYYNGFLPIPDATGTATAGASETRNYNQYTGRFDFQVTEKQTFAFTANHYDNSTLSPFPFGGPPNGSSVPGFGSLDLRTTQNYVARHTYALTPNIVNSLLLGYARNRQPSFAPQNQTTPQQIGFTGNFVLDPQFAGPPIIFFYDRVFQIGNTYQGPQARTTENFQIQDSLSWAKGDHRFKFGFDGTLYKHDQAFLFINQGAIGYTSTLGGNTTGDDYADFLIGNSPYDFQIGSNGLRDFRQKNVAFFGQDTWRTTNNLTLSLGLRWEYTSPITDKFRREAYYRPGTTSQLLTSGQLRDAFGNPITIPTGGRAPNGVVYVGDPDPVLGGTVPQGGVRRDFNNIAPRFGFAWTPAASSGWGNRLFGTRETVIRGGFGIYYGSIIGDTALQQLTAPGFSGTDAYFDLGTGTLANPFAPDPYPNYTADPSQPANAGQIPFNPLTQSSLLVTAPLANFSQPIDPLIRTPYTYQYNLTFERSFMTDYVLSLSYVGNRGYKQYAREQLNYAYGTFIPFPTGRTPITPTTGGGNTNSRRVNTDIQVGIVQLVSAGRNWYDAFQANLQRRYSKGLLFQVAYTFSKSISDSDNQRGQLDLLDRRFGRSLSSNDAPHRFVASFIYDFPFANRFSGVAKRLLGGWSFGGIATFQSGLPFTVNNPFNTTGTGGGILSFADLGAAYQQTDPRKNNSRAFNVDAFRAFGNTTAVSQGGQGFDLARDFRRGTSGPNQFRLNNGINNWDLILSKRTQLWNEASNFEIRFEAFNAFNHTQFLDADLNLGASTANPNPNFGRYTSARESRVIQLGARLTF